MWENCLYCLQFTIKNICEEEVEKTKQKHNNNNKPPTYVTSNKCNIAVCILGQHLPMSRSVPHAVSLLH